MAKRQRKPPRRVETLTHGEASRKNIPTAEFRSVMDRSEQSPVRVAYERRNRDLDPQLVWRGKDEQDWSDLVVQAPPLYIQEKVHPKVLIDDLRRRTEERRRDREDAAGETQPDLFADFNGLPDEGTKTEFYQHDANWSNRMILGDSLQVMASLAEREGLRGKVQCIYLDPPYGIKFNSNFQWSTTSRDVKDGKAEHISREPEQVKAFRDTWRDGVHSYLTYLRDRLTVARDLLAESGSIFVQIGDENVHRVRALLDDVFGAAQSIAMVSFSTTTGSTDNYLGQTTDYLLWYCKSKAAVKYRPLYKRKVPGGKSGSSYNRRRDRHFGETVPGDGDHPGIYSLDNLTSQSIGRQKGEGAACWFPVEFRRAEYRPTLAARWKTNREGIRRLLASDRLEPTKSRLRYVRYLDDFPVAQIVNRWDDVGLSEKSYVVQTSPTVVQRCVLMATDPGDLVVDPTCGSGTAAFVAEQWGRRWITIDTSRVALTLARARIMGARYPYYHLADTPGGQRKEAEVSGKAPVETGQKPTRGDVRQGFVYERVPHITLKSIANNAEIDVIWERWQEALEPLRDDLNARLDREWEEWEIPREAGEPWPEDATALWHEIQAGRQAIDMLNGMLGRSYTAESLPVRPVDPWSDDATEAHRLWWEARIARQQEIDASIAARADYEYLYDKPYEDNRKVRVAGPFTVESLSPHHVVAVDEDDELLDRVAEAKAEYGPQQDFATMILGQLATAGVQQAHKEDRIAFAAVTPWPGSYICAEGRYAEGRGMAAREKRAGIFIGPEFGTVSRPDLVAAAREAGDAGFDVLIACAFNYEAQASEFDRLGRIPVLKARMNADLHMAGELKNTGKGNLFVVFGEPDIDILPATGDGAEDDRLQVKINGVDVFHPNTGEVRSDGADGIACWFIDTDYNEESFFVRHAYFLGANDPYKALKTTLKAEIDPDAWATLNSDVSRPFDRPESGRIAVKVINHLGDEVMKVFRV